MTVTFACLSCEFSGGFGPQTTEVFVVLIGSHVHGAGHVVRLSCGGVETFVHRNSTSDGAS